MKMNLSNQSIMEFYQTLTMINGVKNTNFNFDKAQNKVCLKDKATPLIETQNEINKHIEKYNKEHIELLKKHANKDENGEPKILKKIGYMTIYDLSTEAEEIVETELKKLREEKYVEEFKTFEEEKAKFELILKETHEVEIVKFKRKDLPDDLDDVMDVLYKYVE